MVALRQVHRPADRANWTEHFYNGSVRVEHGIATTDNQNWIEQLLMRGFRIVEAAELEVVTSEVVPKTQKAKKEIKDDNGS